MSIYNVFNTVVCVDGAEAGFIFKPGTFISLQHGLVLQGRQNGKSSTVKKHTLTATF